MKVEFMDLYEKLIKEKRNDRKMSRTRETPRSRDGAETGSRVTKLQRRKSIDKRNIIFEKKAEEKERSRH